MQTPRDPAHYLKPIVSSNVPQRLLWLDCALRPVKEQGLYVQRWGGAALGTTHWTSRKGERKDVTQWHADMQELWDRVDGFCVQRRRCVLWSYDLATQLRVSGGLLALPALGWQLENIVLERTSGWARFTDGDRSLLMCDLRSWTPVDFGVIAQDIEDTTHKLRGFDSGPDYLPSKHKWRASIIRDAVLQIMEWLQVENLGPFRPTGSGQSFVAYRKRFMSHKLLVHDDIARLEAERAAMHTGRCEAWQHGKLVNGPFVEYDMHAAYCTIGRDCEVPITAQQQVYRPTVKTVTKVIETHSVLAHVTVTTGVPCVPAHMGGRTVWPVGTFRTWLWDPELTLIFQHATKVEVHHAWKYRRAPALAAFSGWVLDALGEQQTIYGRVPQRVVKHWSRCLVGRLGLRYRSWQHFGTCPDPDLRLVTYIDVDAGTSTDLLCAGNDRFILTDMIESAESLPQIPSWVMSECRARLWDAISSVGQVNVLYVDTDSIIIRGDQGALLTHPGGPLEYSHWLRKGTYRRMTVHGPRNYTADTDRHVAGLPLTAKQVAPLEFTGHVMRSVKESMRAGQLDCVAQIPRRFVLDAPDLRRQHLPGGGTAPFEVSLPTDSEG